MTDQQPARDLPLAPTARWLSAIALYLLFGAVGSGFLALVGFVFDPCAPLCVSPDADVASTVALLSAGSVYVASLALQIPRWRRQSPVLVTLVAAAVVFTVASAGIAVIEQVVISDTSCSC